MNAVRTTTGIWTVDCCHIYCVFKKQCVVFNQTQAGAAAVPEDDPELPTMKDVCVAYCSVAEIYLSDLWYGSERCII